MDRFPPAALARHWYRRVQYAQELAYHHLAITISLLTAPFRRDEEG